MLKLASIVINLSFRQKCEQVARQDCHTEYKQKCNTEYRQVNQALFKNLIKCMVEIVSYYLAYNAVLLILGCNFRNRLYSSNYSENLKALFTYFLNLLGVSNSNVFFNCKSI